MLERTNRLCISPPTNRPYSLCLFAYRPSGQESAGAAQKRDRQRQYAEELKAQMRVQVRGRLKPLDVDNAGDGVRVGSRLRQNLITDRHAVSCRRKRSGKRRRRNSLTKCEWNARYEGRNLWRCCARPRESLAPFHLIQTMLSCVLPAYVQAANYNPFGKGGGGAPLRDTSGHVVANLRAVLTEPVVVDKTGVITSPRDHQQQFAQPQRGGGPPPQAAPMGADPYGGGGGGFGNDGGDPYAAYAAPRSVGEGPCDPLACHGRVARFPLLLLLTQGLASPFSLFRSVCRPRLCPATAAHAWGRSAATGASA